MVFDPASALAGCAAGICSTSIFGAVTKKSPEAKAGATDASPANGGQMSPSKWASPVTHLRKQPPPAPTKENTVDSEAFLTRAMANFAMTGSVAKDLDRKAFVDTLRRLIAQSKFLQNNPRLGIVPQEKRAAEVVLQDLAAFRKEAGGPLVITEYEYVPGRTNLKVVYPGTGKSTVSFVGSHFDVVPADPEAWDKDPFTLTVDGDKLYGRGTTDCLGHVALLTRFLAELGRVRPTLKRSIVVLFIAGEEGGEKGVGVDLVVQAGNLDEAKNGPVYWVDSADSQPCCGTSGMLSWSLKCKGRLFHSGFPNKAINSIELASEACSIIQQRFFEDFPPHPSEAGYQFTTGSHMKPTQIECAKGSMNQICPETTVSGDIRLSPFYEVEEVMMAVEQYVADINQDMGDLPNRGPWSKFELPSDVQTQPGEQRKGQVELIWHNPDTFKLYAGIACRLDSEGHKALVQSCREVFATVKPFSVNGSLPLVKMMQKAGFDIQLCGFGLMSVYHGVNEYCTLNDMSKAWEVVLRTVCLLESVTA